MANRFKTTWFCASLGRCEVEYAKSLQDAYEQLDADGYDVVNVVPISMGTSEALHHPSVNYRNDVGFGITRGAVVVGKRRGG